VNDGRQDTGIDARTEDGRNHRGNHGERGDGKDRLAGCGDSTLVVPGQIVLREGVLDGLPLANEVEDHH